MNNDKNPNETLYKITRCISEHPTTDGFYALCAVARDLGLAPPHALQAIERVLVGLDDIPGDTAYQHRLMLSGWMDTIELKYGLFSERW